MVKKISTEDTMLYECGECGFRYTEKQWAEKCAAWCKEHASCNIEIISHGLPPEVHQKPKRNR